MTLEETKRLADNGDVGAMMALAEYYVGQKDNDENAVDMAFEYYERAAMAGNVSASLTMERVSRPLAKKALKDLESVGPADFLLMAIEKYHKWSSTLLNNVQQRNSSDETKEFAYKAYLDSVVWQSTVYFYEDDFDGILRVTENIDAPVTKALRGMAMFKLAETDAELETAFAFLKNAEHYSFWEKNYMSYGLTEAVMIETANILCNIYRIIHKDINAAYNILSTMHANANSAEMKAELREKLSKYRRNRHGRYEYIG